MMSITTRAVEHTLDGETFESIFVLDDARQGKRPAVLVFHAWDGRSEEQVTFAKRLTAWGYASLAVDLFGKGKRGKTTEECQALMTPLVKDRGMLRKRVLKVLEVTRGLAEVEASNIGAIGFCFGGLCALDLARTGADVKGVASFHGILAARGLPSTDPVKAKVIAYHGWDDPFSPPDQVLAFTREFTDAGADWQLQAYGGTKHAFTAEGANNPQMGLIYSAKAAVRSWASLELFLAEAFGA